MFCTHLNLMGLAAIVALSFFGASQTLADAAASDISERITEYCNNNVSVSVSKDSDNNVTVQINNDSRVFLLVDDFIPVDIQDWANGFGVAIVAKDGNVSVKVVVESNG